MKASGNEKVKKKETKADMLRTLKHDIKNQLSNIYLALEQLRYEIPDATEDCTFYLESISISSAKIESLLRESD